jgi:anti-sigma-K factor RskA
MSHDLNSLVGAYVLDALTTDEQEAFETHLRTCSDCSAEVRDLQAAATELSHLTITEAPSFIRDNVLAGIDQVRPLPPFIDNVVAIRRSAASRLYPLLAAAAAVLLVVVGGWGYQEHRDAQRARVQASSFTSLLAAPDAKSVIAHMSGGGTATVVVSRSRNEVALVADAMPKLAAGKTYQLWTMDDQGKAVSLGIFEAAQGRTIVTAKSDLSEAATVGVSVEKAGGATAPTLTAVVTTVGI